MGVPRPEDDSPLAFWKTRRLIRNLVWLAGGLVLVWLALVTLHQSRENERLLREKEAQAAGQVVDLAQLLELVQRAESAAAAAGRQPSITSDQAVEALKRVFPPEVIDAAVRERDRPGPATTTTTTGRAGTTTTTRASTPPSTAAPGPPGPAGPPGPPGPPGADSGGTGTTTTTRPPTTTTTTRPCTVGLLGLCVQL